MSEHDNPSQKTAPRPPLADLKEAAKPTGPQNFRNYFGFGYVGNTATAIVITNGFKKLFPKLTDKWAASYEKKFIAKKEAELITPFEETMNEEAKAAIREKIQKDAKEYGHKTVEGRLLASGGFAMLPFQSAAEINDYSKNIKGIVEPYANQHGMSALKEELAQQMEAAIAGKDNKTQDILANALNKPKFSPLGPSASKGLPKWVSGRVVALGTAFTVQKFVDDSLGKQKDAMDATVARIITKITGGVKSSAPKTADGTENAFDAAEAKASAIEAPEGVDPKILGTVRMITTDAYMTAVAIGAQKFMVGAWDNKLPKAKQQFAAMREKLMTNNQRGV